MHSTSRWATRSRKNMCIKEEMKKSESKAMVHIQRALEFGTELQDLPPQAKLMLVKQATEGMLDVDKLSRVNREFFIMLEDARRLYYAWQNGRTITDAEVRKGLAFSELLFCYAPDHIQRNVHIARDILEKDPKALHRCMDVLFEIDDGYKLATNKDGFIATHFPHVMHSVYDHHRWNRDPYVGGIVINSDLPVDAWIGRYTKYEFYRRKEFIRRLINQVYMELKIEDIDTFEDPTNQQPTFFDFHAKLTQMEIHRITIHSPDSWSWGTYDPYAKQCLVQMVLVPIYQERAVDRISWNVQMFPEHDEFPDRNGVPTEVQLRKIVVHASLEEEWASEQHKIDTHKAMQDILKRSVKRAVGYWYEEALPTCPPFPRDLMPLATKINLHLAMAGTVCTNEYESDEYETESDDDN